MQREGMVLRGLAQQSAETQGQSNVERSKGMAKSCRAGPSNGEALSRADWRSKGKESRSEAMDMFGAESHSKGVASIGAVTLRNAEERCRSAYTR